MNSVKLTLLGSFRLEIDGSEIRFPTRKTVSLFAYLALHQGEILTRSRLAGLLWPDVPEERARRNLSTTLWRLKKTIQFGPGIDLSTGGSVTLRCDGAEVDILRFRSLLELAKSGEAHGRLEALKRAQSTYHGELLEGLDEEWCEDERRHLRSQYGWLLRALVQACRENADYSAGATYAQEAVALNPLDEDMHRELMLLHYLLGDQGAAVEQYRMLKLLLHDELNVEPSESTKELWEYLRSRSGSATPRPKSSTIGVRVPASFDEFEQVPMIGREEYIGSLIHELERASRGAGVAVIISGEAGVGKTRLVESAGIEARLRGFEVLRGRCPDLQDPPPYQVFLEALWPRVLAAEEAAGRNSPLAKLLDALGTEHFRRNIDLETGLSGVSLDSSIVIEILLGLLDRVTSEKPTLLILEDVHRIDRATETLVISLLGRVTRLRLMVVATARSGEGRTDAITAHFVANGAREMPLPPLPESETYVLVRAALKSKIVPPILLQYVWERTSGIPLFILELLKFLSAEGFLRRGSFGIWSLELSDRELKMARIPARMHQVIRRRMAHLDSRSSRVLCSAAVLGGQVDFDHLHQLTELPEDEFVETADHLVRGHLLEETEKGFKFPHESIRVVALSLLGKTRLRLLHLKVASFLESHAKGKIEDLCWHFEEAGIFEKAALYAESSGDRASSVYANRDAVEWYSRALAFLAKTSSEESALLRRRATLLLRRQEVLDLLGNRQAQTDDIESLLGAARELKDHGLFAQALYLRANFLARMNANRQALATTRKAARIFATIADVAGEARTHEAMGLVYINLRQQREAYASFKSALTLFRRIRDRAAEARVSAYLGTVQTFNGQNLDALRWLERAEFLLEGSEDRRTHAATLLQKGVVYRCLGRLGRSEALLLAGIDVMKEIGDRVGEARGLSQLGYTRIVMGRLRDALHDALKALRISRATKDVRAQIVFLNNAAHTVFRCLGDFNRAEECIREALRLVAETGRAENPSIYYDTMSAILLERGEFEAALRWAKRAEMFYRSWAGHFHYVGTDIRFRLGLIYLELGQHSRSLQYLRRASSDWRRRLEMNYLAHAVSALARLHLARGETNAAEQYARQAGILLHQIDGTEQVQKIYWCQFQVYSAMGSRAAARRALRQAYATVMQQASTLKGRIKKRFLTEVKVNRAILEEVARTQKSLGDEGVNATLLQRAFTMEEFSASGERELRLLTARFSSNGRSRRIQERRQAVLKELQSKHPTQPELARILSVSVRTVRSDVAALRAHNLLPPKNA